MYAYKTFRPSCSIRNPTNQTNKTNRVKTTEKKEYPIVPPPPKSVLITPSKVEVPAVNTDGDRCVIKKLFNKTPNITTKPSVYSAPSLPLNLDEIPDYGYDTNYVEKQDDMIPMSFLEFGLQNIRREVTQKRYGFRNDPYVDVTDKYEANKIRRYNRALKSLALDDKRIWEREQNREQVQCPRMLMTIYYTICYVLDVVYKNNPIARFWFLETVARMPYFSYVSILQMYEALGWWELDGSLKRKHLHEEENETHHLRIMESLGGSSSWWNRFLARHGAMVYYGVLLVLFMTSPRLAYLSSELLEMHAVDTYMEFYESNERVLKSLPPTKEAMRYKSDAWNMYDIFKQIANDELQHAKSMKYVRSLPDRRRKN